jgi:ketosteroid isomerase-like protein
MREDPRRMGNNADVVKAALQAWRDGDAAAMLEALDPGIEWEVRPDLPDADTYRGHEGVQRVLARFSEVLDDQWIEPREEMIEIGDQVVMPLRWGGRGKGSGVEFEETRETWIGTVRDGKIVRVKEYATKEEAMEAIGAPDAEPPGTTDGSSQGSVESPDP